MVVRYIPVLLVLFCTSCALNDPGVFRWQLEYDVEHGRGIDLMFLANARDFPHSQKPGPNGETIWEFENSKTDCKFEYVTDSEGRGIKFRYLSPERNCYVERKFRGG